MNALTRAMLLATSVMPLCATSAAAQDAEDRAGSSVPIDGEGMIHPEIWPALEPLPLDPEIEARIDRIMARMTLEQKVGQIIQADSSAVTPEEVKQYRLGSVLSGGNSAPGPLPYASADAWLELADAYWNASTDAEGVDIAIPIIWGIDAVHGHANLFGATVFPHNVGLGAANDPDLVERIMRATARELVVSGHDWTFAPTLAVPRDDRWGRGYEGFSESPEIVVSYSDRIVEGLQGAFGSDSFLSDGRILSSAKHFIADGGTDGGRDQGDASISEEELRDVHAMGYLPAIEAGVQTVMISFSSWQGVKMTANRPLITDVLKGRMGFNGFVVSDWNAHGQIPGCSNTDCPEALDAGLDMFMAPDSWKGLYESTLAHAKSGRVPMARLDDAVRRILRVKLNYGLFEKAPPSARRGAGDTSQLSSPDHAALAREAVRKSLVLLKNEGQLLPLEGTGRVLVVGDGADSIAKASGGWTLSWQGGAHTNDEFPGGTSILDGIRSAVEARGGTVVFDRDGTGAPAADVVIAVYGEDAYAEFQGDRQNVDFDDGEFDTARLAAFREAGIPVVSVFLSGRPLWTNPEINASDAFVAAWLPGSQGAGVADVLFQTDPAYDFTGRLSFSWPRDAGQAVLNVGQADYDPLFPYGYGLSFGDESTVGTLPEDPGIDLASSASGDVLFTGGRVAVPWSLYGLIDGAQTRMNGTTWDGGDLAFSGTDRAAQEDSLRIDWRRGGPLVRFGTFDTVDFSRQSNGAMELAFFARNFGAEPAELEIGLGCTGAEQCAAPIRVPVVSEEWQEVRVSLSCFADRGIDLSQVNTGLVIGSKGPASVGLSDIRLAPDIDAMKTCGS
ncbi:glycoside hydrolase family 3 protein [Qipengyuania flava]|uniref:glycoside hydrolase family 3 protein n=1 Tax=Qipengyuania flava TaxID=192812 RepID=UPI001C62BA26|nr:glycoside hydrolase family 3 protein [Qipengyuania flava]QYJ07746.1 exo 1,3/1,4-beta-D-glucan glucohydrolase [Qipengyuania flava]